MVQTALLAVIFQAIKAALVNLLKTLRIENEESIF
jgi:hypothetical protein